MACLSSRGPGSLKLLQYAAGLASITQQEWYAVYVRPPGEGHQAPDPYTAQMLAETLTLAASLGAQVFTVEEHDIADGILRFALDHQADQVVIGRPKPLAWEQLLKEDTSIADELIHRSTGLTVIVIDTASNA